MRTPLFVDEGFLCRTCKKKLPLEEWDRESSFGQCKTCWQTNPMTTPPRHLRRDIEVIPEKNDKED